MNENHYFTNKPEVAHDYQRFSYTLRGEGFEFLTDANVFSKKTIDFGSRLLIETFSDDGLPVGAILDVGCGYGPMGLSLAKTTGRRVEMVDVNERAVELSKQNAATNKVENADIHLSNIYEDIHSDKFAAIISNPPIRAGKKVVHEILEKSVDFLLPSGTLTIVIQKKQGAPSAKSKMEEAFGNAEIIKKDKGYFIIQSVKEDEA
jgi:16S rRNA (guanine1207-N2)-methyltransferase